jgi:hypothetical protein
LRCKKRPKRWDSNSFHDKQLRQQFLKSLHRENSGGRLFVYLIGRHKGKAEIAQETAHPFFLKRLTISRFQEMDTFNGLAIVSSFFIIFR